MQLRNLRRAFIFAKVLKSYPLSLNEYNILFALSVISSGNYVLLNRFFSTFHKRSNDKVLFRSLSSLMSKGYIIKTGSIYSLSSSGYALLLSIEKSCRICRVDKY